MKLFVIILTVLLINNCATVVSPEVVVPTNTAPQISQSIQPDEVFLKRKVAIARFSNETKYGKGFFNTEDMVAQQAMDILSSRLTQSGKFILLERNDISSVLDELNLSNMSDFNIPADYLILGSVTAFGRKTEGDVGALSRTKKQTANATVNIRLIDVKTGQIIYSEEGSAEAFSEVGTVIGMGSQAGYDASLDDKAISGAITKLVSNIIENLLEKPWRSFILDIQDGTILIAGGKSQGIAVGDSFSVYKRGKTIKNPQTGFDIELPGTHVGDIDVFQTLGKTVNDELSICMPSFDINSINEFTNYYVEEKIDK